MKASSWKMSSHLVEMRLVFEDGTEFNLEEPTEVAFQLEGDGEVLYEAVLTLHYPTLTLRKKAEESAPESPFETNGFAWPPKRTYGGTY